jgi:S1-C subfamily serine protease
MQDSHNVPIQPDRPPQGTGPVLQRPTARPGLRIGAVLAGLLALVLAFSAGLVSGCQIGQSSATATSSSAGTAIPPLTGNNIESVREAVVAKVRPSVVQINVTSQQGAKLGSGVIIDSRGYIVTNNHVITGGQTIVVELFNGSTLPAQIVGTAPSDDLAVLKVNPSRIKLAVATIGDSSKLKVGQDVLAIGNPLGITQTVTSGIVSALDRNVSEGPNGALIPNAIQTDAPINPGNSGGALVDLQGNLVGIPTLTAIDPEFKTPANGVGFAIPSNRVSFIVPQLVNSGRVTHSGRAALGVEVTTVDAVFAAQNNLPVDHGALITGVTAGGPAAKAGLRAGDIIVQVDNKQITDVATLADALLSKNPGDTVQVGVYRGSQQLTVKVKLGELPAR